MSETINYHLFVEDNPETNFKDVRERLYGTTGSNMTKIDEILYGKAVHSISIKTKLLGSAWSGIDSPFVQTIAVEGLKQAQNGNISVAQEATMEERNVARDAMLSVTGQSDGTLTISADGEMPEIDIPVVIILLD